MSAEAVAGLLVSTVQVYLAAGLAFAVVFVLVLVRRLDPSARGASIGFRVVIIPGVTLLWPLLLARALRGKGVPLECSAHRLRAAALARSPSGREHAA